MKRTGKKNGHKFCDRGQRHGKRAVREALEKSKEFKNAAEALGFRKASS